jgi:hypothetical protein
MQTVRFPHKISPWEYQLLSDFLQSLRKYPNILFDAIERGLQEAMTEPTDNPAPPSNPMLAVLLQKFKESGGGQTYHWSDDLWLAYTSLVGERPSDQKNLMEAYLTVSSVFAEQNNTLGLREYDDIFLEDDGWYGVKDDAVERLPESVQGIENIAWCPLKGDYIPAEQVATPNPPKPLTIFDAGMGKRYNIFTGEEE